MGTKTKIGLGTLLVIGVIVWALFNRNKASGDTGGNGDGGNGDHGDEGGPGYPIALTVSGMTLTRTNSNSVVNPVWILVNSAGRHVLERNAFNPTTRVPELSLDLGKDYWAGIFPNGVYTVWVAESSVMQVSNAVTFTIVR